MSENKSSSGWEFDENGNARYVGGNGEEPNSSASGRDRYSYHYSYNYDYNTTQKSQNRRSGRKEDNGWHWAIIVLAFIFAWPVGLILLFLELFGVWKNKNVDWNTLQDKMNKGFQKASATAADLGSKAKAQYEETQKGKAAQAASRASQTEQTAAAQPAKEQARTTSSRTQATSKRTRSTAKRKKSKEDGSAFGLGNIRAFRWLGSIMAGIAAISFVGDLSGLMEGYLDVGDIAPILALGLSGAILLLVSAIRSRKVKKFKRYLSLIGRKDSISVTALADALPTNEKKAMKDLQEMLDRGYFDTGYLDAAQKRLFLTEDGVWEEPPEEPEPEAPKDNSVASATLQKIRDVNAAIANPEISAKIDRIEQLTAKIFRLVDERPEKAGELRQFMNYYLPQTLKILENYSRLEAQGIEGANIVEAKSRIESMMDKLVDGYEAQLDKLFADDVMDISADLQVMENMLEKDGLTADADELRL